MADSTSSLDCMYEEEYRIEKRADGTEDFHCIISSCAGVFSYRTLRALNNHRTSTHKLPEVPKRKRGPKKSESSRNRSRSADAIKRQVIKRAIDISKREQGCRSMARLRASRLAMAQSGGLVDKDHMKTVIKEVDKSLETWEGDSSRRRSLLERRIQMARLEWAIKGEAIPFPGAEAELPMDEDKETLCFHSDVNTDVETSDGKEFPGMFFHSASEEGKDCCAIIHQQHETSLDQQIDPNTDDFEGMSTTHAGEMVDIDGNICGIGVHMNCEKGSAKKILCSDKYDAKNIWHNFTVRKLVSISQHEMKMPDESALAQQTGELVVNFDRDKVQFEYSNDTREL